jgi:hypothetical protein
MCSPSGGSGPTSRQTPLASTVIATAKPPTRRNVIERMFCRLTDFRRIATRYDKRADIVLSISRKIQAHLKKNQCRGKQSLCRLGLWSGRAVSLEDTWRRPQELDLPGLVSRTPAPSHL